MRIAREDPEFTAIKEDQKNVENLFLSISRCIDNSTVCSLDDIFRGDRYVRIGGMSSDTSNGTFSIAIKARTRSWLPIITSTINGHRKTFILVGALHLPDLIVSGKKEMGLISLLRAEGYTVQPIRTAKDIRGTFLDK